MVSILESVTAELIYVGLANRFEFGACPIASISALSLAGVFQIHALVHALTEAIVFLPSRHCGAHHGCGKQDDQHYVDRNIVSEGH